MNVLWIIGDINLFPEAIGLLNGGSVEIKATGGWIYASASMLVEDGSISLAVVCVSNQVKEVVYLKGKNLSYYVLPPGCKGKWQKVVEGFNPQIVHIHGTENFKNIIDFLDECDNLKCVVSLQGVADPIAQYIYSGFPLKDRILNTTIADFKRKRLMFYDRYLGELSEKSKIIIGKVHNVIGRTICDRSYTWAINQDIRYFFCNETLREEFYTGNWVYSNCEPHTVFLSQASRPLKGLHILLKALPLVKRSYPDLKIKIAGDNFVCCNSISERIKQSGYGKYIRKIISRLELSEQIEFLGSLNAEQMKNEYLKCNLFLSPSTIENSPNSLCEAQMLGVPCLASYVGGVPDMIPNVNCGQTYRFDDINALAYKICEMFEYSKEFDNTVMKNMAHSRHNAKQNVSTLKNIYEEIIKKG